MHTFFSSSYVDFTFFCAHTQNDTYATRFEIIPGLLGVDCRRAIRLRRDHVLRVEGRRENHRRRHRRGAWRRLHTEGTFLLPLGEILIHFFRARARKKERRSPQRRRKVRSGEKNNATLSLARDSFAERRFFASRWGVVRERFSSINLRRSVLCSSNFRKCETKVTFSFERVSLRETCFVLIVGSSHIIIIFFFFSL